MKWALDCAYVIHQVKSLKKFLKLHLQKANFATPLASSSSGSSCFSSDPLLHMLLLRSLALLAVPSK